MATKPSLVLKRRLKAAPEKVYEAWTKPEQMTHWWGVAGGPRPPVAETDLRVGGRFKVQFWDPKNEHHSVSGVYREVVPNRKLAFSWAWQTTPERESLVTIELNPVTEGTMLTLTHEQFVDEKARDDHGHGWNVALDRLETFLA
jgi:uncharacterized protein YndB with AHSA1/START domain